MAIEELGKVHSDKGGRTRLVKWDSQSGDIYVEGRGGFTSGSMKKIGMKTKNKADAMEFARSWLDADRDR